MSPGFVPYLCSLGQTSRPGLFSSPSAEPPAPRLPREPGVKGSSPDHTEFTKPPVPPSPALRMLGGGWRRHWNQEELTGRREEKARHRGRKEVAAGGRGGNGKVCTGPLPAALCTRDFLHTRGCTHSLARVTAGTQNPLLTPWAHTCRVCAVPATDTHAQATTRSHSPAAPAPLPAPAQPRPPARSWIMTSGQTALPLPPPGVCGTPVPTGEPRGSGAWAPESAVSPCIHVPRCVASLGAE